MPRLLERLRRTLRKRARHITASGSSFFGRRRYRHVFDRVETYCMFLGGGRSGSSILGALLDAHENVIIGHELNVLERLEQGSTRDQIYYLLLRNSRELGKRGRGATGYDYTVPNQWQGRYSQLGVIGDKKAGGSSKILIRDPHRLLELERMVGVEIRCIHCLRNPYDNITTIARRRRRGEEVRREDLEGAVARYFEMARSIEVLKQSPGPRILDVRHEDFVSDPKGRLREICAFLGIEATEGYLADCASIVYATPHRSRFELDWPQDLIAGVRAEISSLAFLDGYSWES